MTHAAVRPTRVVAMVTAVALLLFVIAGLVEAASAPPVTIYFNGSCHDCVPYLDHELVPLLRGLGVGEMARRDYILERRWRAELVERSTALGFPRNCRVI